MNNNFWKKYFHSYDSLMFLFPYKDLIQEVSHELNVRIAKGSQIVDLGCGTGNFSIALQNQGYEVIGIDSEQDAVKLSLEKGVRNVVLADISGHLPVEDSSADAVILINVLYAVRTSLRENVLKESKRVLKKGGVLILVNPKKSFSIIKFIYETVNDHFQKEGLSGIAVLLIKLPIFIKIITYNVIIQKKKQFSFFEKEELRRLIKTCDLYILAERDTYKQQSLFTVVVK